ncbi:MAG: GDP-L-fucose synthase [Desulfuromonadia bacterium]
MSDAMNRQSSVFVAGHRGLTGSAVVRRLESAGYERVITRTRDQLDLVEGLAVERFFAENRPEFVVLAAAKVGGIVANSSYPADFIDINLSIQNNVIQASRRHGVKRLIFLGSSCIYPKFAPQPLREEYLLTGPLEPTNEPYAVAKISGIIQCRASNRQYGTRFLAAMPTNLYGPNDNFDLTTSHVLPALIRKFHEAKRSGDSSVMIWGSGTPLREFLHVDDLADAILFLLTLDDRRYDELLGYEPAPALINVGSGEEITIRDLASLVARVVGYSGDIVTDPAKPDGTPRKVMDVSRLASLGWTSSIPLEEGVESLYRWYLAQVG